MGEITHTFKLHRIFQEKDEVIGRFIINSDGEITFPSNADKHNCNMFPAGPMSNSTKHRIAHLLDNKEKTMYLEKIHGD